jgi:hypothetical protein
MDLKQYDDDDETLSAFVAYQLCTVNSIGKHHTFHGRHCSRSRHDLIHDIGFETKMADDVCGGKNNFH